MGASLRQSGGGGRRGRGRARTQPMSEINVTPFVDVMLVLLIIFMVAAPLLTVGVPLDLPKTEANPLPTPEETPLTIQLTRDGRIFVEQTEIPQDGFLEKLLAIAGERREDKVFIRADQGIAYGRVMEVMGALNRGGFRSIGLVTDPAEPGQ